MINPEGKESDALGNMLLKKPLFQNCVSCDKELDQYQGRLQDYRNWKVFPPKETSPERMGRFGVGFTQIMQIRKQNIEKEKELVKQKEELQTGTNTMMNSRLHTRTQSSIFPEIN